MPSVASPDNSKIIIVINDLTKPCSIARLIKDGKLAFFFRMKVFERNTSQIKIQFIGLLNEEQISIDLFGVNALGITLNGDYEYRVHHR